jgi:hypothetical protein
MADTNAPTGADAWAEASRRMREQQLAPQVANSIGNAATVNADSAAKANVTARFLNIPPESAAAYPDDVARQVKVQQLNPQELVQKSPVLSRFLTVQSNANAMHPDIPALSQIEQTVSAPKPTPVAASVGSLLNEANHAFGGAVAPVFGKVFQAAGAPFAALDAVAGTNTADVPFSIAQWFNEYKNRYPTDPNAGFMGKLAQTLGSTAGLVSEAMATGGESVAPRVGAGVAEVLGAHVAHGIRAMTVPSAVASQETAQHVMENGGSVKDATKAGLASYVTNTLGGVVPFATPGKLAYRLGSGAASGVLLSENSRNLMDAALPPSMRSATPTYEDRLLDAITGAMFGGFAGPHAGARGLVGETAQAHVAEQDMAKLTKLGQLAATVKLKETDPEGFNQVLRAMTEDGHLPNVYVKADTFAQTLDKAGISADELKIKMPEVAAQMTEALHTQGDVKIPTADFLTHIAGGPLEQPLLEHVKTDPEGKTFAEAKEFYQGQAEQMKEVATKLVTDKAERDAFRTSQQAVQDQIHAQLDALGRHPTDVNKINATVQASILSRVAALEKITPEEAMVKYGARLAGAGGEGFDQAAYHGSPHDFDKFSLNKIGTGEGAQAYGHGLYFAEDPRVAEGYRRALTGKRGVSLIDAEGKRYMPDGTGMDALVSVYLASNSGDYAKTEADLRKTYGDMGPVLDDTLRELERMKVAGIKADPKDTGALYTVDIPDEHVANFLHWDKPLSEQPEVLHKLTPEWKGGTAKTTPFAGDASMTGQQLYNTAKQLNGTPAGASKWLNSLGIKGIKYLDGNSRDGGEGTHNLVVFDDKIIKLTHKDGKPVAAAERGEFLQGVQAKDSSITPEQSKAYSEAIAKGNRREALRVLHNALGIKDKDASIDRGGAHAPSGPEDGAPAYDVAKNGVYPEDVYSNNGLKYYSTGEDAMDADAYAIIKRLDGHPNAIVTIYRAVEKDAPNKIHPGDWVTTVRQYAKDHGEGNVPGGYKIIKQEVKARDIFTSGDSWLEWGYHPQDFKPEIPKGDAKNTSLEGRAKTWAGRNALEQTARGTPLQPGTTHIEVDGVQRHALNSNGQPIAATEEGVRNFWRWFGDSKVVDADGKPLVVYHGTRGDFDTFGNIGGRFKISDGYYFTTSTARASVYADSMANAANGWRPESTFAKPVENGANVMPIYLRAENPLVITEKDGFNAPEEAFDHNGGALVSAAKTLGHDSVLFRRSKGDGYDETAVVAFKPEQIKSATGNSGEFDPANPSILKQEARGTYNPSTRTIALLKDADLSTYLHETGHWALDMYSRIADSAEAPPEIRADMDKILKWFGVESLDVWHSMSLDEQRPYHEKFAVGFEQYLLEGKAPSQELSGPFARIRAWMTDVYKGLRNLGVDLTPEVRGVFDRMLASEEQIQQAQAARVFEPLFTEKPAGMRAEEWSSYVDMGKAATDEAIAQMQTRSLRDMKWLSGAKSRAIKDLQRQAKAARDEVQAKVEKEVGDMPVYQMQDFIKEHKLKGDALDTELLAERFGFGSGEEAMRALAEAPNRKEVIEGMTDRRMIEEHGELSSRDAIEAAANEAVHNAVRARFMATGLKILAKSPISARTLLNGAREAAEGAIAAKRVGDINPKQYLVAETRANKEAIKLAPKDPEGALQAQRAALLNNQLVKAAYDAQDMVRKALAYAKSFDRISKRLKIEPEERDMIDALLARFDFRQNPPTGPTKQQLQLTQWVESQKAMGYTPTEIPDMLNPEVRMHYKDMSVEQLRGLMDTIRSIEKIGRERRTMTVDGKRMDVAEAAAPIIAKMQERGEKFTDAQLAERPRYGVDPMWRVALDRMQSTLRAGVSEFMRPDYKGNKYDLHEILGPFQKAFSERLFKAAYDHGDYMDQVAQIKRERREQYGLDTDWQKTLDTVVDNHSLMDHSLDVPQKRRITRGDLIGIAMHVGNESNFDKLVKGMEWAPEDIWRTLHDNMSEKDWNAAKTLGEMAGAKWDEVAAMNRRLGNDNPDKIEPRAFQTKYGEMPGWYAPISYDPIRSRLARKKADAKAVNPAEGLFSSNYYRADTTTNGSLNSRASGYYDFIDLSWRPIEKRIADTMRDLAYREALIDVHKLYTFGDFRRQFQRTYGPEEYKHLGDWLGRLVNSEVGDEKQSKLAAISAMSRRALVANGVAFRISTMLKHGGSAAFKSTGYFTGGGEKYFANRIAQMATNHNTQVVEALAKFPEIRQRARQQDRDFANTVASLFEPESLHGKAERFGHAGVSAMDFFTAVPTAHAAYDWAITEGVPKRLGGTGKPMSEADAIAFASKVVREAHGSTNEASQSLLITNKSEIIKTLTTLHGFMNNAFGQNADSLDKLLHANGFGKPEILARTMMAQVVPAIMAGWVTFGGPNDQESWLGWAFHHIGGEFAGMLPMVREGWSATVEGFTSAGLPPWIRALTDIVKVGKDVAKGDEAKHPIKDVGNAAGLLLPGLGQAGSAVQFLYDEFTGKQHAETVAEWIRGVMSGTAKHEH